MTVASTAGKALWNTVKFPLTHPKASFAVAGGLVTTAAMATTGLPVGQAFGQVSGKFFATGVDAVKEGVPYLFNSAVDNAPNAFNSVVDWGKGVFDAAEASSGMTDTAIDTVMNNGVESSGHSRIRGGRAGAIVHVAELLLAQQP